MNKQQQHLAWHETLELHELVAFQSIGVMKLKKILPDVTNPSLQALYTQTIQAMQANLKELIAFYPKAPSPQNRHTKDPDSGFYAGDLLALAKTLVRNYAIAITETATPYLRDVFVKQLNSAIKLHAQAFQFMYENQMYPSYNLDQLLKNDVALAQKAISL